VVAVADHQPTTLLVNPLAKRLDMSGDLGLHRRRQHLPSTLASELVEQRAADSRGGVLVGLGLFLDYLEHGRTFPNQRANAGPDQNFDDFQIILGKVRSSTSPGRGPSTGSDHCSDDRQQPRLQFGLQFTAVQPSSSGSTRLA